MTDNDHDHDHDRYMIGYCSDESCVFVRETTSVPSRVLVGLSICHLVTRFVGNERRLLSETETDQCFGSRAAPSSLTLIGFYLTLRIALLPSHLGSHVSDCLGSACEAVQFTCTVKYLYLYL